MSTPSIDRPIPGLTTDGTCYRCGDALSSVRGRDWRLDHKAKGCISKTTTGINIWESRKAPDTYTHPTRYPKTVITRALGIAANNSQLLNPSAGLTPSSDIINGKMYTFYLWQDLQILWNSPFFSCTNIVPRKKQNLYISSKDMLFRRIDYILRTECLIGTTLGKKILQLNSH